MEYAVIGAIVVGASIAVLAMVGGTFEGTMAGLKQDMATHRDAAIRGEMAALDTRQSERLNALSKGFSEAEASLLQQGLSEKIQTAGANGSTRVLAKQLALLADQLLKEGKVTQDQYALLMKLSNQGYRIAKAEELVEDGLLQAKGDPSVFTALRFNLDGQDQSAPELAHDIGFVGVTPVASEAFLENINYSAGPEMNGLLSLYQQMQDSGLLADPVVRSTVESAVLQIAQVGEGVEHTIATGLAANEIPQDPPTFNGKIASLVTTMDSSRICKAGNFKSDGIQCSSQGG